MRKREFHLQDDQSNKFWTIEVVGDEVVTTNGRIGAKPRETRQHCANPDEARALAEREILGKRRKGYSEGAIADLPPWHPRLPPRFVRINHDDYDARYVGKLADGRQFFLTFPFTPDDRSGGDYIALYLFDEFGQLLEARVHSEREEGLGTRDAVAAFVDRLLGGLGKLRYGDIRVAPFSVTRFGRTFGLVFDPGEVDDDEDDEDFGIWVNVLPGDYMAFYPPWDGDYDT